jgi:exopolysaccharide biosynthesis polyprenyl glycosylphosphotransferase
MIVRYSEAEDLSAGGRVATMRVDDEETAPPSVTVTPRVIDLRPVRDSDPVILHEPAPALPQQERHAVGRFLRGMGHILDFAALSGPLVLSGVVLDQPIPMRLIVTFAIVGTVLLWPTARRGRLVVVPSEGLLSVVARVGLAPVVTLIIFAMLGWDHLTVTGRSIDVFAIVQIVAITTPILLLGRLVSFRLVGLARARGYDLEDTLIVGTGPVGVDVAKALEDTPEFGLVPTGFVDRFDDAGLPLPIVGRPEHLREVLARTGVRHVILAFGAAGEEELVSIIRSCGDQMVQFYAVPRLFELGVSAEDVGHEVAGLPLVPVRQPGASARTRHAKRAFDLAVSAALLVLTAPLMVACALAVKLSSSGPVFFRQVRVGIGGQPFEILKFRTMKVNDDSATTWSVHDDERVTRIGRFLRPSHLDELPQLINVLRGEMSLVGPRPERPHFVEQFGSEIDGYHFRHRVPVGITGWAQVHGYWGDTSIETRVRLDNRYIENWSLWRDLVIALRTVPTLLGKRR